MRLFKKSQEFGRKKVIKLKDNNKSIQKLEDFTSKKNIKFLQSFNKN